jgi:hypothetical protein
MYDPSWWLQVTAGFILARGFILVFHAKSLSIFFWDEDDMVYTSLACSNPVPDYTFSSDSFVQFFQGRLRIFTAGLLLPRQKQLSGHISSAIS